MTKKDFGYKFTDGHIVPMSEEEVMKSVYDYNELIANKIDKFYRTVFCEFFPEKLHYGVLYVSEECECSTHLCPCGCGNKVHIPISVTEHSDMDWTYKREGDLVTFNPSLLNKHCPNKAHYFVRANKIVWT